MNPIRDDDGYGTAYRPRKEKFPWVFIGLFTLFTLFYLAFWGWILS